jgi:hypothetical protein
MIDLVGEYCASLRRMPLSAAQELHSTFGIPWPSITATCPVPTRPRFADKARSLYEPDEDGGAGWVIPATCVDPARPEEIEAVDPLDVVSTGPIVDLVAFHPHCRDRFALRIGHAVVLGAVDPAETQEMKRAPLHWRVPSGGGRIVRGGGRAPAISGMRRNPETEIDPLPPDLRDRYRIYMQERLPWFGRPPRPPALGSPRASD